MRVKFFLFVFTTVLTILFLTSCSSINVSKNEEEEIDDPYQTVIEVDTPAFVRNPKTTKGKDTTNNKSEEPKNEDTSQGSIGTDKSTSDNNNIIADRNGIFTILKKFFSDILDTILGRIISLFTTLGVLLSFLAKVPKKLQMKLKNLR